MPVPTTCERITAKVATDATFHKLSNGLTLIHQEIPTTATVTVDVWVEAGAVSEPNEWSGMAHFLEHMIFKGTNKILPGQFDYIIESQGGVTNAATSHDYAHFMFTTAANHFAHTLPHLAEMLLGASIPDHEFNQERLVVIEEIHQAWDDPDWLGYQNLLQIAYGQHPYSRSVLGTPEILQSLTPERMRQYHRSRYRPELMTVVVVGAVSLVETIALVSQAFDVFQRNTHPAVLSKIGNNVESINNTQLGLTGIRRKISHLPRLQHSRLTMAWLGPSVANWQDALRLELLAVILAGGRSSRLVRELREELGWVQDIGSSFSMQKEPSLFSISAHLDACYLEHVEHKIQQHVSELGENLVTSSELTRAKRNLRNNFAFAVESPYQLAGFLGYHGMLGCKNLCANWSTAYTDLITAVEPEDLQDLAKRYLSPNSYVLTSLMPEA